MSDVKLAWLVAASSLTIGWAAYLYNDNKVTCEQVYKPDFALQQFNDANMYAGETKITQQGNAGITENCSSNAKFISSTVIKQPTAQITAIGTKEKEPVRYTVQAPVYDEVEECPITTCNDGSCSSSTGRGTCSWHGGVASYNY